MGEETVAIPKKVHPTDVGQAVARLAADQYGVVTVSQLRALEIDDASVRWRLESGRLHRLHRGVYAVGHTLLSREGRYLAATLACGPRAALSHRSASDLWGIRRCSTRIEITVGRSQATRPEMIIYRSRMMDERDFTVAKDIRVTTPSRTLLDLASVLTPPELSRAVDRAERLELFNGQAIGELLKRSGGRAGAARLRAALAEWKPSHTRSELEDRFQKLLRAAGIEKPLINVRVSGRQNDYEVDCYWAGTNLIVQLDGFTYHRTRRDRERDASTDADLELAGYRVLRLTWGDVVKHGERSIARVRMQLARPR